jgi:hypothetical protein
MLKLFVALGAAVLALVMTPAAHAQESTLRTFVVQLSAENEVPACPAGVDSGATGVAVVQINAVTGQITYRVVAFNLPAEISGPSTGAHIHVIDPNSPTGLTGPIVVHFERTGLNTGLIAEGTNTDLALAAAILANPENYYVNVHTTACPLGTIRGQLG